MRKAAGWQSRPVFITSTFRDMHAERDWLRERVLPELEERLRERRAHLEPIDLRWGVENLSAEDEEAKELIVLKVCLDEIERSRPFLIGLIGDRYGWVPPEGRMQTAIDEKGFRTDVQQKSVTALEIEFGVLDSPDQRRRSHFFFRDPLPYDDMSPEVAAQYSDAHSADPDVRRYAQRLGPLKERIERELPGRVHHYSATWDADQGEVTGLEVFEGMVLEALWADLEAEITPLSEQKETTWEDEERLAFEEFIELAARDFVGRERIASEMLALARSPAADGGTWGGCVTGPSGSGKSALLGYVARNLQDSIEHHGAPMLLLSHFTGVTPRSQSVDAMLIRWIGELAEFLGEPSPVEERASADDLEEAFASLLGRAALQTRVVVLLDALNQFEPTTRARHMTWLPKLWPANARLIATAIPCQASDALLDRPAAMQMPLQPLPQPEAEEVARRICARYHRTPHPDVIRALINTREPDDTPAAGNPLWLTLAVEELNLLDQDDFERADREFTGSGDQRMQRLLLSVVEQLPPDVAGLYEWMLAHTEEIWGETWARAFANVTALSRAGWRDSDYERLLPTVTGETWDPATVAGLRRSFRGHLARRGAQEQWDFAHSQTRPAILRRNLPDAGEVRRLHSLIADHLQSLPRSDPVHESEMMYHLIGADDRTRASLHYGDMLLTEGELAGATQRLAEHILATVDDDGAPGLAWATSLLAAPDLPDGTLAGVAERFMFRLLDVIENDTGLGTRLALLESVHTTMERLASQDPGNPRWQHHLTASYQRTGDVRLDQGDLPGALSSYELSLAVVERLAAQDPGNAGWQRGLSVSHDRIGDVRRAQGDLSRALSSYEACRELLERLASQGRGNAGWQQDLSTSYRKVGDVHLAQGDLAGALAAYEASLEIEERLASQAPGNAGWQRDLSVGHIRIGDVRLGQGDVAGALAAYEASLAVAERLASQDPGNAGWQRDLSVNQVKIGDVRLAQGDLSGALSSYEACREILERLASRDPGNAGWQRELSVSRDRIGDVRLAQGDPAGALAAYEASLAVAERLTSQDPGNAGWQHDLSMSHDRIGDVRVAHGDSAGALAAYEASLAVRERLTSQDPVNAGWQRDLSVSHDRVGDVRLAQGDLAGALAAYEASLEVRERLAAQDAGNAGWQRDLSVIHDSIGDVRLAQGDLSGALSSYEASLAVRERLAAQDPGNAVWQRDLALSHSKVGDVRRAQGALCGALSSYGASLEIREGLGARNPGNAVWQRDLSVSHERIGDVRLSQGDLCGALSSYETSLQIRERSASRDPGNAEWQRDLWVSYWRMGAMAELTGMGEAFDWWQKAHARLMGMKQAGMYVSPQDEQFLQQLKQKLGR
jgi:tetratricopeptide (TPR) repeat protein